MRKILIALVALVALVASSSYAASVTVAESAPVFKKPGFGGVITTVKAGTVLNVVEAYPCWYEIEYTIGQAKRVWINVWNHVTPRDCDPCTPVVTRSGDTATISASVPGEITSDRNARLTPDAKSEVIGGIPAGTSARIVNEKPLYFLVETSAGRGYVPANKVTK